MSYSYRKVIDETLTCMAQPYKTKVLKKIEKVYVDGIETGENHIGEEQRCAKMFKL